MNIQASARILLPSLASSGRALLGRPLFLCLGMAYQGEDFAKRYGKEMTAEAPPIKRILAVGVPLGAGTDATRVASYNPWVSLYWLVTGLT